MNFLISSREQLVERSLREKLNFVLGKREEGP
jgi:hypothetical protein